MLESREGADSCRGRERTAGKRSRTCPREAEEKVVWQELASEAEHAKAALILELQTLQSAAAKAPPAVTAAIVAKAEAAAAEIDIDEASTRTLIDAQLRARGWEADSQSIRHSSGSRPTKGKNLAIAEWPTKSGTLIMPFLSEPIASAWLRQSGGIKTYRLT